MSVRRLPADGVDVLEQLQVCVERAHDQPQRNVVVIFTDYDGEVSVFGDRRCTKNELARAAMEFHLFVNGVLCDTREV